MHYIFNFNFNFDISYVSGGFAFYSSSTNKCYLSVETSSNEVTCSNSQIPFLITSYPGQYVIITNIKNNNLLTYQPSNSKIYATTSSQLAQIPYSSLFYIMCPDGSNSCDQVQTVAAARNKILVV